MNSIDIVIFTILDVIASTIHFLSNMEGCINETC